MVNRVVSCFAAILLCAGAAQGQQRLTSELSEQIRRGIDRLGEDEVLKLVPGPVTVEFDVGQVESDYVLRWEEVRRIRVESLNGRVSSATGTFSDVVDSKTLTLANLKKISKDLPLNDVKKLLAAESGGFRFASSKDSEGRDIEVWTWEQGRVLKVYVKGGKVNGLLYMDTDK